MFYVGLKGYFSKNRYGASSTFVSGIFFIIFGFYDIIFEYIPYPYTGFLTWWIGIVLGVNLSFSLIISREIKKIQREVQISTNLNNIRLKKSYIRRFIEFNTKQNPYQECISLKMEAVRKSFHLAGILILLCFFGFFFIPPLTQMVNENVLSYSQETESLYNILWGDLKDYPYKKRDFQAVIDITAFILIASLVFMIVPDLIRILWGPEYSILNLLTKPVLRNKELNSLGPQIFLLTGIIFSYTLYMIGFVHFLVVFTGISIACFSDGLAAVVGRFYGKHKVHCIGGNVKSIEGFIAGTSSAFIIGLILLGPIYAIFAAFIFFLLDYFPSVIADNILNPILIIIGITVSILLLGLPIGWM
jgi:dolichol kinase